MFPPAQASLSLRLGSLAAARCVFPGGSLGRPFTRALRACAFREKFSLHCSCALEREQRVIWHAGRPIVRRAVFVLSAAAKGSSIFMLVGLGLGTSLNQDSSGPQRVRVNFRLVLTSLSDSDVWLLFLYVSVAGNSEGAPPLNAPHTVVVVVAPPAPTGEFAGSGAMEQRWARAHCGRFYAFHCFCMHAPLISGKRSRASLALIGQTFAFLTWGTTAWASG